MMEIEVKGHSGCSIEIVREGNVLYIEKGTQDIKYAPRLLAQFAKQQNVTFGGNEHIRVPHIFEIKKTDTSVVARMEYIYSQNFIDYFETAGLDEIDFFIRQIINCIEYEITESATQEIAIDALLDKFADVQSKIESNPLLSADIEILELTRLSGQMFLSLPKRMSIPIGVCHGDLTFSNILFNRNGLYLIDFLDSFIETPLMDIVKLRQDTAYGWSKLMFVGNFDQTRLQIISSYIDKQLSQYFAKYTWVRDYYRPMQLMNFLRILQYAKDSTVVKYLKKVINQILKGENDEI